MNGVRRGRLLELPTRFSSMASFKVHSFHAGVPCNAHVRCWCFFCAFTGARVCAMTTWRVWGLGWMWSPARGPCGCRCVARLLTAAQSEEADGDRRGLWGARSACSSMQSNTIVMNFVLSRAFMVEPPTRVSGPMCNGPGLGGAIFVVAWTNSLYIYNWGWSGICSGGRSGVTWQVIEPRARGLCSSVCDRCVGGGVLRGDEDVGDGFLLVEPQPSTQKNDGGAQSCKYGCSGWPTCAAWLASLRTGQKTGSGGDNRCHNDPGAVYVAVRTMMCRQASGKHACMYVHVSLRDATFDGIVTLPVLA